VFNEQAANLRMKGGRHRAAQLQAQAKAKLNPPSTASRPPLEANKDFADLPTRARGLLTARSGCLRA